MTGSLTSACPKINLSRRLAMRRSLVSRTTSGDGRHDRDLVLLGHLRLEAGAEPDVLVIEVDVHELAELAVVVEQAVLEARVAPVEGVDRRPDIGALDGHGYLALGEAPKRSGDTKLRHGLNIHLLAKRS